MIEGWDERTGLTGGTGGTVGVGVMRGTGVKEGTAGCDSLTLSCVPPAQTRFHPF